MSDYISREAAIDRLNEYWKRTNIAPTAAHEWTEGRTMTPEELVKRLRERAKWISFPHYGEEYPTEDAKLMTDAADAIEELTAIANSYKRSMEAWADEAANAQPRWIPVTERLPEDDCHVLAYYGFNHGDGYLGMMFMQVLDFYARDPAPHFQHEGLNGMTVTHWMPLPEPPKEEA